MISKEDVKKLAELARIEMSDSEAEGMTGDMDAILDYVGQVSAFAAEADGQEIGEPHNVLREDAEPNESGAQSKELIAEFPDKEGDYLKVKKIL